MTRMLLVDRDAESRRILARYLERRGLVVEEAADPTEALHLALTDPPALVVTESVADLPGLVRGLDAIVPGIPVLVWSAHAGAEARCLVEELGCVFLTRPAYPQDVAFRVARLLTDRGREPRTATPRPRAPARGQNIQANRADATG